MEGVQQVNLYFLCKYTFVHDLYARVEQPSQKNRPPTLQERDFEKPASGCAEIDFVKKKSQLTVWHGLPS